MRYEKEQCPICGKQFDEKDEIVVCPECGTPQHRECYNSLGKCVNDHMHSSGFAWTPQAQPKVTAETEETVSQENAEEKTVKCVQCGMENKEGTLFCRQCGAPLVPEFRNNFAHPAENIIVDGEAVSNEEFIDSDNTVTVREAATFIQKNKQQYIKTFLDSKKKRTLPKYNISALILGPLWFFYRKIHKIGLALAGIYFAVFCFIETFMMKAFSEYINFYVSNYNSLTNNETVNELVDIYYKCVNTHHREIMYIGILIALLIVINFVIGFFANRLYLEKIKESVKKIKSLVPNDTAYFNYLYAKGGTTLLGAFNAAFLVYILLSFVSSYVH